jgi:hypothetical protein
MSNSTDFDFKRRLAELVDEARDSVMSRGSSPTDEAIIAALEETAQALKDQLLYRKGTDIE